MNRAAGDPRDFRGSFSRAAADRSAAAGAAGILEQVPEAIAVPRDPDDVVSLVKWAVGTGATLVPRGAATGMPGGNVGTGVAVDLCREFRACPVIDAAARRATVQPGTTLADLNAACHPMNLHFPVDPSSGVRCSLGGMIANNAAGAHSVKYGATRAWVETLDVVLADGSRTKVARGERATHDALRQIIDKIDTRLQPHRDDIIRRWPRVRKNSSGYALREYLASGDVVDLLVGSEGTLALIVGAELRLAPLPSARGLALLEFHTLEAAGDAVQALLPAKPATCEMLDRTFIKLVRAAGSDPGYPLRAGLEAILLVEVEGNDEADVRQRLNRIATTAQEFATNVELAADADRQERFWSVRHAASPLIAARDDDRVSMQFIEDGVVPVDRLPDYVRALRRILAAHDTPAVIFGHAGDGNLHVNPLVDVANPSWRTHLDEILRATASEVVRLGGTLAGEHGDGRLRAPLLETIWGAEMMQHFRAVKAAFDPDNRLNPGVILPLPGQSPLDALRSFAAPARHF